jgi:hypothetical protein
MTNIYDYLSPEKKLNRPEEVSDVWSIAVTKYWLMTTKFPEFDNDGEYKLPRKENLSPKDNIFFNDNLKQNPSKRRPLRDMNLTCPPVAKIAGYYNIPESQVRIRSNTSETTISHPLIHTEANE